MSNTTFIELIEQHKIVIPIIQRDYAQGRSNERSKAIKFLDAISKGFNSSLNLDFVYGKVNKDKFIPLDGQQRLTTLLLLHWYMSLENKYIPNLHDFSYEVRSSTRNFIEKLTLEDNWKEIKKTNVRDSIENSNWFFQVWKKDPTVIAILNMLELIEQRFQGNNVADLNNITFDFLNLEEFDLTDELYVKMNARGKALSNFENFKASFEKFFLSPFVKAKLDNAWQDIFWKIAKKLKAKNAPKKSDEMYYNFFINISLFFDLDNLNSLDDFILEDFLQKYTSEQIDEIETILDKLVSYDKNITTDIRDIDIFSDFLKSYKRGDNSGISYEERARFYSLKAFYIKYNGSKENEKDSLKSWTRVCLNLINNTSFDNITIFKDMIKIIDELSTNISGLYKNLVEGPSLNNSKQFKEEVEKAKLILIDSTWEKELLTAESNWYLDGQVGFLLSYSENNIVEFIRYRDQFIDLFDKSLLFEAGNKNFIYQTKIHAALLFIENYLPRHGKTEKYTFCVFDERLRIKNENWRNVFGKDCFKILLEQLRLNSIDKILINNKLLLSSSDLKNWKKIIIEDPMILSYAKNYQVKITKDNEFYLNRGYGSENPPAEKWGWERVAELNTVNLFNQEFGDIKPLVKRGYYDSSEYSPCFFLGADMKYKGQDIAIDIRYEAYDLPEDPWEIKIFFRKDNITKYKEISSVLSKLNFEAGDSAYYYSFSEQISSLKIVAFIKKLSVEIGTLTF